MNIIPDANWPAVEKTLKASCPRLTASDFAEAQKRVDLLTAKIQNRHWISRIEARRTVFLAMQSNGVIDVAKIG